MSLSTQRFGRVVMLASVLFLVAFLGVSVYLFLKPDLAVNWYMSLKDQSEVSTEAVPQPTIAQDCDSVENGRCFQNLLALQDVYDTLDPSGRELPEGVKGTLMVPQGQCGLVNIRLFQQRDLLTEENFRRVATCY